MTEEAYRRIIDTYEENPKVQILHKFRGKKAFTETLKFLFPPGSEGRAEWASKFSEAAIKGARAVVYARLLRTKRVLGVKLVIQHGAEVAIVGEEKR